MPEIWLRYGATHVVLDIKSENLASHISAKFQPMSDDQLRTELQNISLSDEVLIIALTSTMASADVVSKLAELAREKGISNITLDVPASTASILRSAMEQNQEKMAKLSINRLQSGFPVLDRMKKFKTVITVSQVGVDPLFGFSGGPTLLLRHFLHEKMAEAFSARSSGPSPSVETKALQIATGATAGVGATGIEIVANSLGTGGIHIGEFPYAFTGAISNLRSISSAETEQTRSLIASSSYDPQGHSTLSIALDSLWNCIGSGILKKGGTATLVCECRNGIGSGALQRYVEGRLNDDVTKCGYIDGLEHLVYLNEMKQDFELALVSALPKYYTGAKLGFTRYSSMKDVVSANAAKYGKSNKSVVISDPDVTIIFTKPEA